jgi:RNA polymerase sigma-70 factor (ECF subfamily)
VVDPDAMLLDALRAGDEQAFRDLVMRYHQRLLRFAESFVPSRAIAEEVVQDTWLGVVRGVDRFEGRASVKTWLFRILANRARSTGLRESRSSPISDDDLLEGRFDATGHWNHPPAPWDDRVESRLFATQIADRVRELLPELPPAQRQVFVLRDIEGLEPDEACDLLGVSAGNQRVLLHRARARMRNLLEDRLGGQ